MSDVKYLYGSEEQIVSDCTTTASGFVVTDWGGELAFLAPEDEFDAESAAWVGAQLAPGVSLQEGVAAFTAAVMQMSDVTLERGKWSAFVRLTRVDGSANYGRPIIPAAGIITVV